MLTDIIQMHVAIRIGPKPPFGPVKSSAVSVSHRKIPKGHRHFLASEPLPAACVLVPHRPHPILAARVASMPSPQFPTYESLQRGVAFVHQSPAPAPAEGESVPEF